MKPTTKLKPMRLFEETIEAIERVCKQQKLTQAEVVALAMSKIANLGNPAVAPSIPEFTKGQQITAQSSKLYPLVWDNLEVKQKCNAKTWWLSNKLGIIVKVIESSRSKKSKLEVVWLLNGRVVLNSAGEFLSVFKDANNNVSYGWDYEKLPEPITTVAIAAIGEGKANLVGASSDLKVVNEEIAIEVAIKAPEPVIEAVVIEPIISVKPIKVAPTKVEPTKTKITKDEFSALLGYAKGSPEYIEAINTSKANGYFELNGNKWVFSKSGWTLLTVEQLELDFAPAIEAQ